MERIIKTACILCAVSLMGCTGLLESKTCGLKNSQWERMTIADQVDYQKLYNENQRLAEQMELNKMSIKQHEKLAKERRNTEKAQKRRLNEEQNEIKRLQNNIQANIDLKERRYLHSIPQKENHSFVEENSES